MAPEGLTRSGVAREIAAVLGRSAGTGKVSVEVEEETDDVKMVREVMEEPDDTVRVKASIQFLAPIEYISITVHCEDKDDK